MTELPLFPVTTVGSWPRSPELLQAARLRRLGRLDAARFRAVADDAVLSTLELQHDAGIDRDGSRRGLK